MKINPSVFRIYDIRGIYPNELNGEIASRVAFGYNFLYPWAKRIVVARDPRLSSPVLAKRIIDALERSGKEVIDIGIAPDPLFYFLIFHHRLDGGFMISGSHNPKNYNGLTMHIRKPEKKISEDVIGKDLEKIKEFAMQHKKSPKLKNGGSVKRLDPSQDYIKYVSKKIHLKKSLKIVIDSGNGSMGFLAEKVFKALGCRVETIYGDFNGDFPNHPPDPYQKENIKNIRKMVLKRKADLGFAYDSDGDRVALIDNRGRAIGGDFCLLMLAKQALAKKKGPIVHDMRVSQVFLDEMRKLGVKTYFSVSHHNAVIDKIIETGAVFGGEITLHFLFPLDYYLCDDALFASLKLAEISSIHSDFSKYIDGLPRSYVSPEFFMKVPDDQKYKIIENLQKYLRKNRYNFINVDGARINFPNGWALARAANTTPHIKCRFEGRTKNDLMEIKKRSLKIFKQAGIPIKISIG